MIRRTALAPLVILAGMAAPACAADHRVEIRGMGYSPATLSVALGDTVTFTNHDTAPHSATARDGSFDTGLMSKGQSATITFATSGEVPYFCTLHPMMQARITTK